MKLPNTWYKQYVKHMQALADEVGQPVAARMTWLHVEAPPFTVVFWPGESKPLTTTQAKARIIKGMIDKEPSEAEAV